MDTYKKPNPDDELLRKTAAQKPETAQGNGFQYSRYQPSDTVKQAQEMLKQQMAQKPGSYQSPWQSQLNDIMGKIMNREKFSYDLNGDALYQQYKDQYMMQGQQAMMDTMGQAAALTGGYGNSYAQTAGQQTYQGYLQQLNDKVPELYQLALDKYQMEGQDLLNQYSMLGAQEEQDYGRYRDQVSDYNAEVDRLQNRYDAERDFDYGKWADGRDFAYGQYADDRAYAYQKERDQVADQQWQKEFDEAKRQYDQQYALTQQKTSSSGGSGRGSGGSGGGNGGSGGGSGGSYDNSGVAASMIKKMQEHLGVKADGMWGDASKKAAKAKYGIENAAELYKKLHGVKGGQPELSAAGKEVMTNLPYAHAGSDPKAWKNVVDQRLQAAYESGKLSENDVTLILKQLGIE